MSLKTGPPDKKGICLEILNLAKDYAISAFGGYKNRHIFANIGTYLFFIGYPRSGHSIIGAMLDAHPRIIVAHEMGHLKYITAGFNKYQLYYLILKNSKFSAKSGRMSRSYSYEVLNQWQGKWEKLEIIGDKLGAITTSRLKTRPWLLQRLRNTVKCNIRVIHVIRNPYDNISTMAKRTYDMNLTRAAEHYFSLCETNAELGKQFTCSEFLKFRHEDFIENPKNLLREICFFLNTDAPEDYLNDCASIVFESPRKTRFNASWNPELIDMVKGKMGLFPFLDGYSYDK